MNLPPLGIDIAKSKFDACLIIDAKFRHKQFANSEAGFQQLSGWLSGFGLSQVHAVLEATASYGDQLARFLHGLGHTVSIVNPARIKGYAQSELMRNKTDKLDSRLIARFCQAQRPEAWSPPPAEVAQLQGLVRRLEALQQMRQQEQNRLEQLASQSLVRQSLENMIASLDQEIERVRKLIREHIDQNPRLRSERELLMTIPGIGETTVGWLLSEVRIDTYSSARQLAAHAGLTPRHKQSGKSRGGRTQLSKTGSGRLRKAIYMPAIVAKRYNVVIRAFCERLAKRGKRPMEIIGAAMRKLLHIVYGVLKSGKAFDPKFAS